MRLRTGPVTTWLMLILGSQPQSIAPASDKSDAKTVYSITGVTVKPPTWALPGSLCSDRGHRRVGEHGGDNDNFVIQCRDPCRSPDSDRTIGSVIRGSQPCKHACVACRQARKRGDGRCPCRPVS